MNRTCVALTLAVLLPTACPSARETASVDVDAAKIVCQNAYSSDACGPASVLNALQFGDKQLRSAYDVIPGSTAKEKMSSVIEKYGSKESVVTHGYTLFGAGRGMLTEDILPFMNAILADHGTPSLVGGFADRLPGEATSDHLRRIHARLSTSLSAGIPVVASVRSFAAQKDDADGTMKWQGVSSHVVVVTSVPKELARFQKGFAFEFVEPSRGTVEEGYAYVEDVRGFAAIKGSGQEHFEWLKDSPFLLLVLPSLNLGTSQQPWHARSFMTLNYLIGQFPK